MVCLPLVEAAPTVETPSDFVVNYEHANTRRLR